jgi:hypothetical protein
MLPVPPLITCLSTQSCPLKSGDKLWIALISPPPPLSLLHNTIHATGSWFPGLCSVLAFFLLAGAAYPARFTDRTTIVHECCYYYYYYY